MKTMAIFEQANQWILRRWSAAAAESHIAPSLMHVMSAHGTAIYLFVRRMISKANTHTQRTRTSCTFFHEHILRVLPEKKKNKFHYHCDPNAYVLRFNAHAKNERNCFGINGLWHGLWSMYRAVIRFEIDRETRKMWTIRDLWGPNWPVKQRRFFIDRQNARKKGRQHLVPNSKRFGI